MNRILFGGSLTLGAKGKLPLLPPPLVGGNAQYTPVYPSIPSESDIVY